MLEEHLTNGAFDNYLMTRITNAVVCGGILAVIKDAWRTCTRKPGDSLEKFICRPNISNIRAWLGTLNLIMDDRFPSFMVVKCLACLSISIILPIVILSEVLRIVSIEHLCLFY